MKKRTLIACISLVAMIAVGVLSYTLFFSNHFKPNVVLDYGFDEVDVGLQSINDVRDVIVEDLNNLSYNLTDVNNISIDFAMKDVLLEIDKGILETQLENCIEQKEYTIDVKDILIFSDEKIAAIYTNFSTNFLPEVIEPVNAYIEYDKEKNTHIIIDEVMGTTLVSNASDIVKKEVKGFNFSINLKDLNCYELPTIYKDDELLVKNYEILKEKENFSLTYLFGETKETIDISVWYDWVTFNYLEDGSLDVENLYTVNEDSVKEYVKELSSKYTTYGKPHNFTTSTGEVLNITKGDYGWWLNRDAMVDYILTHLQSMESVEKEAIFKQKAYCFGESDFSDSYVEVSIENQRVWMYVDGVCIVDTPVVTGNASNGNDTRKGIFSLTYKTRNATLRGAGYASFVYYWMPFDGGIGLHDATWRSSFGGKIYKTNGSHGCVNMPLEAAKTVYENLKSNMPIIVW